MKKQFYFLTMLILIGFLTGCDNFSKDSSNSQVTQSTAEVKNQKIEQPVEDSLTLNEFKRVSRTADLEEYLYLGSYGHVDMPTSYSVLSSSIRHLGGGYYGAIIHGMSSPVMSVAYIEFNPNHEYSVIEVYGGGAGRSTQFTNWHFEEVNNNLSPDEAPYFKALLSVLNNRENNHFDGITTLNCDLIDEIGNNYQEGRECRFSYYNDKLQVGLDIYGFLGEYVGQPSCQYRPYDESKGCFSLALEGDDNPFKNEYLSKLFR